VRVGRKLADAVKRHRRLHRAARKARLGIGHLVPPRSYPGIPGRVHFNDFMFVNNSPQEVASYAERARNVLALIDAGVEAGGKTFDEVDEWLDFGCGYGRVIRFLVEKVPPARISASDVVKEGVDFCQSEFGVNPIYSQRELARTRLGSFDFIYAISVLTHLNEPNSVAFLRLLGESLNPGGIALFTTHGHWSIEHAGLYGAEYQARKNEIAATVQERGHAYLRYLYEADDYGIAWHSREYVERTMIELHRGRIAPLMFKPRGLDGHQDVFAFQRI
jgi:2-polyprenyl-3-methyl-5-hydroxy-6-metoxy-1,4-benzoquinol methylase